MRKSNIFLSESIVIISIFLIVMLFTGCLNKSNQTSTEVKFVPDSVLSDTMVVRLDPKMDGIIPHGAAPEIIAEGFEWSEGPVWVPELNAVLFSDIPNNSIFRWSEEEGPGLYLKPAGYTDTIPRGGETGSNGLLLDNEGRLVLCQHGDRRMARMNAPLDNPEPVFITLADRWDGKRFNSPNDAVYSSSGDLYFTDPAYGMEFRYNDPKREMDFTGVFRLSAGGELILLTDKMGAPNGIGLSVDEQKLYVANSGGGENSFWMVYNLQPDGTIDEGTFFYKPTEEERKERGAPDGLEVREDGIIFATGPGGVWILTPEGKHLGTVRTGQATSNCTIGNDGLYLYMTADMYLMRIRLQVPG